MEGKFKQLQRQIHPDLFSQKSKAEQVYSDAQSSLLNKAYQTLLQPHLRAKYMLNQLGYDFDEQRDYGLTPDFLNEMVDWMDAVHEDDVSQENLRSWDQEIEGHSFKLQEKLNDQLMLGQIEEAIRSTSKLCFYERLRGMVREKLDVQ